MDPKFRRKIDNEYPYPIALEFRRLYTEEFLNLNEKRLQKLLQIAENTIHFLALIGLVDLCDNHKKNNIVFPDWFTKEFQGRFTRTTFGKWIAMFRDTTRLFQLANSPMFIPELVDYFHKGKGESDAQKAFNNLTVMRNKLYHDRSNLSSIDKKNLCVEAEEYLETIIVNLEFITNYQFYNVGEINVKYSKFKDPYFIHTFSEVIGTSPEFRATKNTKTQVVNTPALIIAKPYKDEYLNLDPLIIHSNEGLKKISDIFMYTDWEPNKLINYKPVCNGGEFNLIGTEREEELKELLLKFWEYFSDNDTFNKFGTN